MGLSWNFCTQGFYSPFDLDNIYFCNPVHFIENLFLLQQLIDESVITKIIYERNHLHDNAIRFNDSNLWQQYKKKRNAINNLIKDENEYIMKILLKIINMIRRKCGKELMNW